MFQLELGDSDSKDANSVGTILTFAVNSPAELKKWLRAVAAVRAPPAATALSGSGYPEYLPPCA